MNVIEVSGSPRDIGRATGEALREEIREHLARFPSKLPADVWQRRRPALVATLQRDLPAVLEEIEATAQGADVPLEDLLKLNSEAAFGDELDGAQQEDRCTNVAFAGGPDGPIWGKNNDRPAKETPRPVCARLVRRDGGLPVLIFTYCGMLATADGMNAAGLAVGHSSVGSVFQQSDHHVPLRPWVYEGLMRCRTTEQFITHLAARPMRGKGFSLLCVDRAGSVASPEAPCPLLQVRRAAQAPAHMNCINAYQLPALAHADRRPPAGKCNALERRDFLDGKLAEPLAFGLDDMKAILRRRERPAICRDATPPDTSMTEYSMIGLPQSGRVLFLWGNPCEKDYQEVTL